MMTDIKKIRKRSTSESEATLRSQDSVLLEFDTLEVNNQQDDSASESVFKKPHLSGRKKRHTENLASKKLDYSDYVDVEFILDLNRPRLLGHPVDIVKYVRFTNIFGKDYRKY